MSEEAIYCGFGALLAGLKWNQTGEGECTMVLKIPKACTHDIAVLLDHVGDYFDAIAFGKPRS